MNDKNSIGIIRETKSPPDRRTPLTPAQTVFFRERFPAAELFVQPSPVRAFTNDEYRYLNQPLREDLSNCDILL